MTSAYPLHQSSDDFESGLYGEDLLTHAAPYDHPPPQQAASAVPANTAEQSRKARASKRPVDIVERAIQDLSAIRDVLQHKRAWAVLRGEVQADVASVDMVIENLSKHKVGIEHAAKAAHEACRDDIIRVLGACLRNGRLHAFETELQRLQADAAAKSVLAQATDIRSK